MKNKLFIVMSMVFALLVIMTACSDQSTSKEKENTGNNDTTASEDQSGNDSTSEEKVTLTFWHGYNPVETEHFEQEVIPKFEEEHNVKINAVAVPYDQFYQKLLTSIAGGTAPDLIRADLAWVPKLAELGALEPLDELMNDYNDYQSMVFEGTMSPNKWGDHYYGLPLDTNTRVLLWNKTLFEEAGLSGPPKTHEEFFKYAEELSKQGKTWGYGEGGTGGWNVLPLFWSAGGQITDKDITKASGYLNSEENVALLSKLVEMKENGSLAPSILGDGLSTADGYAKDKYGMIIDGPWMVPIFKDQYPDLEVQMTTLPEGKAGSISVVGGEDIVIFKQSKHKKKAADFIRFMLSKEIQLSMAEVGQMPVIAELADSDYMKDHPYYGVFMEQLKTAKARTPHPEWSNIDSAISTAVTKALLGQASPKEALDSAAKEVDQLLAK